MLYLSVILTLLYSYLLDTKEDDNENDEFDPLSWSKIDKGDCILYDGETIECIKAKKGEDNHSMIFNRLYW